MFDIVGQVLEGNPSFVYTNYYSIHDHERKDNDCLHRTRYVWQSRIRPQPLAQTERPKGVRPRLLAVPVALRCVALQTARPTLCERCSAWPCCRRYRRRCCRGHRRKRTIIVILPDARREPAARRRRPALLGRTRRKEGAADRGDIGRRR